MKTSQRVALAIIISFFLAGCSLALFSRPRDNTESRPHPLGTTVYNLSKEEISEDGWELWFYLIESSYNELRTCLDLSDPELDREMRSVSFILLPARPLYLFWSEIVAFTTLDYIYLRADRKNVEDIKHEWIHVYLWHSSRRWFGDPLHLDRLFEKCEYSGREN